MFDNPNLPGILVRTLVWVVAVVAVTMLLSLGLAQLYNQKFPGRRFARWAIIAPWAASVMMTSLIFRWMLAAGQRRDQRVPARPRHRRDQRQPPTGSAIRTTRWRMMAVAVFVSLPFTTYVLLAGLQAIPGELYEAARVDGAVALAHLPADHAAAAAPGVPGRRGDQPDERVQLVPDHLGDDPRRARLRDRTTTVFMYDLKGTFLGQAAAMSIVNFGLVVIIVLVFLRVNRWNRQEALTWRAHGNHPHAAAPPPGRRPRRRRAAVAADRVIAAVAYVIAVIFVLPYLEMLVTALRPQTNCTAGLPAAPLRLVQLHQHVGVRVRHHVQRAGHPGDRARLDVPRPARRDARGVLHRPAQVPRPGAFLLLVLATQMLQPTALIVGIYKEFLTFGLLNINPVWSLILVNAGFNMAFAIWILNAYFGSIPVELEEAAMVDGAPASGRCSASRCRWRCPASSPR